MFASFKMEEHKSIEENLDVFLKLVDDLASLSINVSDEDQAIQVLSSLPRQFDSLVYTLKYGNWKETLTLNEVTRSAYAKEVELKKNGLIVKTKSNAKGLVVTRVDLRGRVLVSQVEDPRAGIQGLNLGHRINIKLESVGYVGRKDTSRKLVLKRRMGEQLILQMSLRKRSFL